MARTKEGPSLRRPAPPTGLGVLGEDGKFSKMFCPAPEVAAWVSSTIVKADGALHNPDHAHLEFADLEFLWAGGGFAKAGRFVLGQAEQVMFRAGGWQKLRQEQQMQEWFGRVPAFLITLDASYCAICSDTEFCALVEHELSHIAQKNDEFGMPAFTKDGLPKMEIRGHDVEEFIGVVRRYGPSADVMRMIEAAKGAPEVARVSIARACGTCLLKAA